MGVIGNQKLILIDLLQITGRSIIKAEKYNGTIALLLCSSSNRCLNFLEEKPELSPSPPVHHHHTTTEYLVANASMIQLKISSPCIDFFLKKIVVSMCRV